MGADTPKEGRCLFTRIQVTETQKKRYGRQAAASGRTEHGEVRTSEERAERSQELMIQFLAPSARPVRTGVTGATAVAGLTETTVITST